PDLLAQASEFSGAEEWANPSDTAVSTGPAWLESSWRNVHWLSGLRRECPYGSWMRTAGRFPHRAWREGPLPIRRGPERISSPQMEDGSDTLCIRDMTLLRSPRRRSSWI